ncbi:MAG TPA: cupin domain-containing protein [Myxococcaceae bacterium]|nr:cupin domain-containing protein [Myxococcaceae bacterium]
MDRSLPGAVRVPASPLDTTVDFLERLGFRLEEIAPADDPAEALMSGHGLQLRLDRSYRGQAELVLPGGDTLAPGRYAGPPGLVVEVASPGPTDVSPPAPAFVHTRLADTPFHEGRAGLLYRDLLPSRLGGRWVASHIRVARGGPVKDRVHHHTVRLQLLYCLSGESELVYEDQGPPFAFRAGDLVLQPPGLRHRVLAASDGFEVVELASPAWHPTLFDHHMALPTEGRAPDRLREGQRFLHAVADRCVPEPITPGLTSLDLGVQAASGGLASARVLRFEGAASVELRDSHELRFLFVIAGSGTLDGSTRAVLEAGDAVALPRGPVVVTGSPGLRLFEVTSGAAVPTRAADW